MLMGINRSAGGFPFIDSDGEPAMMFIRACVEGRVHVDGGIFLDTPEGRLGAARAQYDTALQEMVRVTVTPCDCPKVELPPEIERQVREYMTAHPTGA